MIKKVLIANRGEIAVRIIRACAEMGIKSVAVYTDADRTGLHVKKADESYNIGPESVAGYLNIHRLVNLALATGCDGLHPGYGFLSENPKLAQYCEKKGINFIGPNSKVIKNMGDKIAARKAMIEAGVPVIPGSEENLKSLEQAIELAKSYGYPIMLKATNGGGGRGIRRCDNENDLRKNYDRVISETTKSFGSGAIFIEKAIVNPKHIEVQIMADKHGNVVHLFERDCSIQRRNQKLIEIAPSPQLSDKQRHNIGDLAAKAAQHVGYWNAGTVEFLMAEDDNFYFMEMNTRLQVEHCVTEAITVVDIVQEQIRVASGKKLSLKQDDIRVNGIAMEFRINAEDPKNDFLPSFGKITRYFAPGGPGIRIDSAIYSGYVIPPFYDSMCAKLIVWAPDWESLIRRSLRALNDIRIYGIKTTIPYQKAILKNKKFKKATFDTSFVENNPKLINYSIKRNDRQMAAVIAASIYAHLEKKHKKQLAENNHA